MVGVTGCLDRREGRAKARALCVGRFCSHHALLTLSHLHAGSSGVGPSSVLSEGVPPPPGSTASRLPEAGEDALGPARTLATGPPCSPVHTHREEGSSMPVPTRAWSRPRWPSVGSTAPVRTACWPGTPIAPGARPRRPVWPCTRPRAPAGTGQGRRACRGSARLPERAHAHSALVLVLQGSDPGHERGSVRLPR